MGKKNKDILKKGLMETKTDFTSNLMDKIITEEKVLSNVLSKNGSLETSKDFTLELMSKLEDKRSSKVYRPVISKSAWIGIAAIFTGVIVLAFLTSGMEASSFKYHLQLEKVTGGIASLYKYSYVFTYTSFGIFMLTLALLFEQRSRKMS